MAEIKNGKYKVHNGTDFDTIHFETKASQVKTAAGGDLESHLADYAQFKKYHIRISERPVNIAADQVFNIGFKPRIVKIHATLSTKPVYDSDGIYYGGNYAVLFKYGNGTLANTSNTLGVVHLHSGAAYNNATCTATDTGFVLTWTASGSLPSEDTIKMRIEALG